jgi:hypothetical protein
LTSYHLDTSAQVERWFGASEPRGRIERLLSEGEAHSTSTHVRREWKRIVDQSAAEILNTATSEHLEDDLPRLAQGFGREPNRRQLVLFCLAAEGDWTRDEIRLRAQHMLDFRSEEMFEEGLSAVRDNSQCGLARKEASRDRLGTYGIQTTCRKGDRICRQVDSIEDKLPAWSAGAQKLSEASDYEDMGKTALEMARVKAEREGRNCYGRTGDLSIALECDDGETILATDASFDVIGPAIGRAVKRIPPTQPPAKAKAPKS